VKLGSKSTKLGMSSPTSPRPNTPGRTSARAHQEADRAIGDSQFYKLARSIAVASEMSQAISPGGATMLSAL